MVELETLIQVIKDGDFARVKAILEEAPPLASRRLADGESAVMAALYRGRHDVVAALIDAGAEIDVFAAAALGRVNDLRRELKTPGVVGAFAYDGWTPLHLAAFFGQLDAARILLDAGGDVNAESHNSLANTPLHAATAGKHSDMCLLLLDRGASADIIDAGGYTPHQIAAQNSLITVVERMAGTTK